jgi:hypothetical protein
VNPAAERSQEARHGVATQPPDPLHSPRPRARCGRPIARPRRGQHACSQPCRFALWAGRRQAEQDALRARCTELEQEVSVLRATLEAIAWLTQGRPAPSGRPDGSAQLGRSGQDKR